jgi:tetratricopeptide (TPR) repeat protein
VRADQWLTYGGIAYAATDNPRTVRAYRLAFQLDPAAFDASQLNAFAGVLDEVGDYATCEKIAKLLFAAAKGDRMWETCAWNHEACALIGAGKFTRAIELAEQAVAANPLPDNKEPFAATLARARAKQMPEPPPAAPVHGDYEGVFAQLAAGEHAAAAERFDAMKSAGAPGVVLAVGGAAVGVGVGVAAAGMPDWRTRRGALAAARFRFASENQVAVTARARAAASQVMAATIGTMDRDAVVARALAMTIREQAHFARDPVVMLGDRMTRGAFYQEFRARGGVVLGEAPVAVVTFVDRVVVPGAKVARASDYIALLRDLAALTPREALAQFGMDADDYVEVSKAWAAAMDRDPAISPLIAAGLAAKA